MKNDLNVVSDINITPLTDVMLVLLIIFMISAPFIVPRGKEVSLPKVTEFKTLKNENNLLIIAKDGSMVLNGVDIKVDELKGLLENVVNASPDEAVSLFIKGDETVGYGQIVTAMDLAKQAGVEKIGLVSRVEEKNVTETELKKETPG